jgi:DNA modification methylase
MNYSYSYTDYTETYDSIMKFNKNKIVPIHQWYPFVEGYSREFIQSIIEELPYKPTHCLEPFSGSGTTPVELQYLGVNCTSFEVNPFMHSLSLVKLRTDYTLKGFNESYKSIKNYIHNPREDIFELSSIPEYKSIVERNGLKNWIFNQATMEGILDIKNAINGIRNKKYKSLFMISLASILLEISNVYRNGKCLSYKKNSKSFSRFEVHELFMKKIDAVFLPDIKRLEKSKKSIGKVTSNYKNCIHGDFREKIDKIKDNSIDLVITSPPYLNSRDYTDTYMVELWMLDFIQSYDDLRKLRKKTFKSHVQVVWGNQDSLNIKELDECLTALTEYKEQFWNRHLLDMIKGYFLDMEHLFSNLSKKMVSGGRIYFNVANSAYYGVEIKVDRIVAKIAENNGFKIHEIREARKIKPSSQQKDSIPYLLEVVLVMSKN